jgi:predicted secreted hydrolase
MRQTDGALYLTGTWINADGQTETLHASRSNSRRKTPQSCRAHDAGALVDQHSRQTPRHQSRRAQPKAWMNLRIPYWEGPVQISGSHAGAAIWK